MSNVIVVKNGLFKKDDYLYLELKDTNIILSKSRRSGMTGIYHQLMQQVVQNYQPITREVLEELFNFRR